MKVVPFSAVPLKDFLSSGAAKIVHETRRVICMVARFVTAGFLFPRLDKQQEKLHGQGRVEGHRSFEAPPEFQSFFGAFPRARRASRRSPGELIFVIYSAEPRRPPPHFHDFAPRKPYFSFNFISNLESLPTARWHAHKSPGIMRTLRLRVLRPLGRRRISRGPAIILFVASPRKSGGRPTRLY